MNRLFPLAGLCLLALYSQVTLGDEASELAFFEERIRPVLVEQCYACHNSHGRAEADLVLDYRQGILDGGASGKIIGAKLSESLLLKVLRHELDGLEMPQGGPKIDARVIADFEKWISDGAHDPRDVPPTPQELAAATSWEAVRNKRMEWWSFQPIRSPRPPTLNNVDTSVGQELTDIDRFLRSAQASVGLSPNPLAEPETLVRRLYFAIVGIPPTPDQIDAFVADLRSDAFERQVDELLDSQRFGERWGRYWLDWMRYAESHGSEGDPRLAGAHHYRDYLIRALNADVPYDQLIREHIAGDLLEEPRINRELGINESVIGTAHWRMVFHGFAPTDALDEKVRFTDDAIDTVSKAFLGLTVSCARCHNHKFDAISQADYYALFGILASTRPGRTAIDLPEQLNSQRAELEELKLRLRTALADDWLKSLDGMPERLAQDERLAQAANDKGHVLHPLGVLKQSEDAAQAGAQWNSTRWQALSRDFEKAQSQQANVLTGAEGPNWDLANNNDYAAWFRHGPGLAATPGRAGQFAIAASGPRAVDGIYPAGAMTHTLSNKYGGRLTSTEFTARDNQRVWLQVIGGGAAMSRYVVENYPRNGTVYPVKEFTEKQQGWHWESFDLTYWQGDAVHLEFTTAMDAPLLVKDQPRSWFGVRRVLMTTADQSSPEMTYFEGLAPLLQTSIQAEEPPASVAELSRMMVQVLRTAIEQWRDDQISDAQALLVDACLAHDLLPNTLDTLTAATCSLVHDYRQAEAQVPVATRVPTLDEWQGADARLFERGNHLQPREIVPRRFLEAIDERPYQSQQSGRDQLASDLLREDNPFTARVIVNRIWLHLFGQGLVPTPDNFGRLGMPPSQPELLDYLATQFREVDHWSIKNMIRRIVNTQAWQQSSIPSSAARQSDPENNFYTHFPMQRLTAESIRDTLLSVSGEMDWTMYGEAVAGQAPRRSIYVRVIRNDLDPFLSVFDAPVPFSCQGRREVTNVPAQSLLLLNGELAHTAARHLANRCCSQASLDNDGLRIHYLWRVALGRAPSLDELRSAEDFLRTSRETAGDASLGPPAENGESATDAASPPAEWLELAHAVLNLKEFIYVR